jgi:hypothetical protein
MLIFGSLRIWIEKHCKTSLDRKKSKIEEKQQNLEGAILSLQTMDNFPHLSWNLIGQLNNQFTFSAKQSLLHRPIIMIKVLILWPNSISQRIDEYFLTIFNPKKSRSCSFTRKKYKMNVSIPQLWYYRCKKF